MELTVIQQLISSLGFPIFVAIWLLIKSSKDMEKMTKALISLEKAILQINERKE